MLVDILLPLAISDVYTYELPTSVCPQCPRPGVRVLVPLGRKTITGILYRQRTEPVADGIKIREALDVLDEAPVVQEEQFMLWRWMADYYLCTLGEVLAAALPTGIIDDDYTARTTTYIRMREGVDIEAARLSVRRAAKQSRMLDCLWQQVGATGEIERRLLIDSLGESPAILRALVERGIVDEVEKQQSRIASYTGPIHPLHPLSAAQQQAYHEIVQAWQTRDIVLLHGVTSSGKTEVYIHLIQEQLCAGKSVLYLVPEIALTTQLTERLRLVFGNQLSIYHSRFSDAERVEIYHEIRSSVTPRVVIGARSAVFLPMCNMGLVILDEEHDPSYKQADPAPRYHARSAAIMMASYHHAKVLLGTATPSVETYYHAEQGKYGLVTLSERYAGLSLPHITLVDLKRQYHRKEMYEHFSDPLVARIREELAHNKQVILFQNRRGYAPYMQCDQCGKVPQCVNCDVSMTLHQRLRQLVCHHCGYTITEPQRCSHCGGELRVHGFGTERIEDEVERLFPGARVLRMDQDSTRRKTAYQDIINAFSRHECDILIGTQMVSKGLHFDDVSLVAVLQADTMLHQPDFRSYERAYQMLEQVAGRAGRKDSQGEVIIQTMDPEHPLFGYVVKHDYLGFAQAQIAERQMFHFPPFHRQVSIVLKHRDIDRVVAAADALQQRLCQIFGSRVSQVLTPTVARVQNLYIRQLYIRIEVSSNFALARKLIREQILCVQSLPACRGTIILPDVDPL